MSERGEVDSVVRAGEDLVEPNLPFVFRVARQYRNLGVPFEDLLNEGNVGLIEAARRYDPTRGTKFSTYAVWWIRRAILRALTEQGRIVKIPEYQTRKRRESLELARSPGSRTLDLAPSGVQGGVPLPVHEVSLSSVAPGAASPLAESLADTARPSAEQQLLQREAKRRVRGALVGLTPREQAVLYHRFGFGGGVCLSLLETGAAMGMSRERVRQIQDRAVERMRRTLLRRFVTAPPKARYRYAGALFLEKRKGDAA
jgi:RNA polymerase primary sigma factor